MFARRAGAAALPLALVVAVLVGGCSPSHAGKPAARTTSASSSSIVGGSVGHVDETAVMALESNRDIRGRTITVLHEHDVRFTGAR